MPRETTIWDAGDAGMKQVHPNSYAELLPSKMGARAPPDEAADDGLEDLSLDDGRLRALVGVQESQSGLFGGQRAF